MFNKEGLVYKKKKDEQPTPPREEKQKKQRPVNIRAMVYCLIATFVLYAMLIVVEKSILKSEEKQKVYVAAADIPANLLITEENFSTYFKFGERSIGSLPEGTVTDSADIIDSLTIREIAANEIILFSAFTKEQSLIGDIENPVEVSMNAANLSQVVGGVIRTGDFINIWSVKNVSQGGVSSAVVTPIYEGAYVTRAFTTAGTEVSRDAKEEAATMIINIVIPAGLEEEFNRAMAEGSIRISRIINEGVMDAVTD